MIEVHITNADLQHALNDLKKYDKEVNLSVKNEITRAAFAVSHQAKIKCPVGGGVGRGLGAEGGRLRASIRPQTGGRMGVSEYTARVGTNVRYAPYVEFGTGSKVQIPAGKEDYAAQFKGKGIRKVNRYAHPFLFPAAEGERRNFENNMEKLLKR